MVLEYKKSNTIELPTDLISQNTHWNVNEGKGQIHPGAPFEIQFNPENENRNSFIVVQDNYDPEEEKKEEVWPLTTFYIEDSESDSAFKCFRLNEKPQIIKFADPKK